MAYEKLQRKAKLKTETYEFEGTHLGDVILYDTRSFEDGAIDSKRLYDETSGHPEKEKMIFLPYLHVLKFSVPHLGKQFRIKYKLEDDKTIVSDTLYTESQINDINFIVMSREDADYASHVATNLHQVVPSTFYFATVMDNVQIFLVESSPEDVVEVDISDLDDEDERVFGSGHP
jgi:hypothetical protein